jgi:hypothetical protein
LFSINKETGALRYYDMPANFSTAFNADAWQSAFVTMDPNGVVYVTSYMYDDSSLVQVWAFSPELVELWAAVSNGALTASAVVAIGASSSRKKSSWPRGFD